MPTSENALKFFVGVRWPKGVICPTCGSSKVTFLANAGLWKCKTVHPRQTDSVGHAQRQYFQDERHLRG